MANANVNFWSTSALLALGVFVTSAIAEDARESDQRRLRILLSAGPVLWIEEGAYVSAALSFRTGTHTAAFVAIDKGPSHKVASQLGFRFVTRPCSSVTPYFSVAYARVTDHRQARSALWGQGVMGEWGFEFTINGRMRAFVGGRAALLGNGEGGGPAYGAVTFGVNVGLQ